MGMLDSLLKGALGGGQGGSALGGLMDMVAKNPQIISTGPNPPISAAQVTDVLGGDTMGQFARKAGIPMGEAGSLLAGLLPTVIDKLTPDGKVPDTNSLENTLSSLLGKLAWAGP